MEPPNAEEHRHCRNEAGPGNHAKVRIQAAGRVRGGRWILPIIRAVRLPRGQQSSWHLIVLAISEIGQESAVEGIVRRPQRRLLHAGLQLRGLHHAPADDRVGGASGGATRIECGTIDHIASNQPSRAKPIELDYELWHLAKVVRAERGGPGA